MQIKCFTVWCCAGPPDAHAAHLDGNMHLDASSAFLDNHHTEQDSDAWFQHSDHPPLGITDYFETDQDMM